MIVRSIDTEGDWNFGKGKNDYKKDNKAVAQSIKTRLSSFLGDCFFDANAGIDWFNLLGGKNQLAINLAVSTTLLNTEDVTEIKQLSVSLSAASRQLSITYTVKTSFGIVSNAEVYVAPQSYLLAEDGDVITAEDDDRIEL